MRVSYERLAGLDAVLDRVRARSPRTVVFDVEPLVAYWDTDEATLVEGVTVVLDRIAAQATGVQVVAFATNSRRRLAIVPTRPGLLVEYVAAAGKPVRVAAYRHLPPPGLVVGDQVATDGVLAWRLGFGFLHLRPDPVRVPAGPRLMNHLGRPLRPLLFRSG